MADKKEIKEVVHYMILAFPTYNPDLESTPNVVDAMYRSFKSIEYGELIDAVIACTEEPGRIFAPAIGEIFQAINTIRANYIKPAYETIAELGLDKTMTEEQRLRNIELMKKAREERNGSRTQESE